MQLHLQNILLFCAEGVHGVNLSLKYLNMIFQYARLIFHQKIQPVRQCLSEISLNLGGMLEPDRGMCTLLSRAQKVVFQ